MLTLETPSIVAQKPVTGIDALIDKLHWHQNYRSRRAAATRLTGHRLHEVREALVMALYDHHLDVRFAAHIALCKTYHYYPEVPYPSIWLHHFQTNHQPEG